VILLQDPISINNTIKFSVKPPRIRSHAKGDEVWNPVVEDVPVSLDP
jgi:hypothetical protein